MRGPSDDTVMQRYVGIAIESTFAGGALAKYFTNVRSANLETPAQRYIIFGGVGRSPIAAVEAPLIPSGSIELPADIRKIGPLYRILAGYYGCFGANPTTGVSTELDGDMAQGATILVVDDEAGFAVGDIVQLGADFDNAELHKVSQVATGELTIEEGLLRSHATGSEVKKVVSPSLLGVTKSSWG